MGQLQWGSGGREGAKGGRERQKAAHTRKEIVTAWREDPAHHGEPLISRLKQ